MSSSIPRNPEWHEYYNAVLALEDVAARESGAGSRQTLARFHARERLHAAVKNLLTAAADPALRDKAPGRNAGNSPGRGIYVASKSRHAPIWLRFRALGYPIISSWIDEATPRHALDWHDLWDRCVREACSAGVLVLYAESDEVLRGAFVEMGADLAAGRPVIAVAPDDVLGNLARARIIRAPTMEAALEMAVSILASQNKMASHEAFDLKHDRYEQTSTNDVNRFSNSIPSTSLHDIAS